MFSVHEQKHAQEARNSHCAFQMYPFQVSRDTLVGISRVEVCSFGAPINTPRRAKNKLRVSDTHPLEVSKDTFVGSFCVEVCVIGVCDWKHTQEPKKVHCVFQTHPF